MTPNYKRLYRNVMCIIDTACHSDVEKIEIIHFANYRAR